MTPPRSALATATGWLAAARPAILPAIGLAVVAVTSCVLPSYSVGGTTSGSAAGGATTSGPATGGAGGAGQSSSGNASVGPGGAGLGGWGTGGELTTCGADTKPRTKIADANDPHGVTVSATKVYWIADPTNVVYVAERAPMPFPTAPFQFTDVCGISGSNFTGQDKIAMRMRDGSLAFAVAPFDGSATKIATPSGPLDGGGCAISFDANGDVYGFDAGQPGVYTVVKYQLSSQGRTTIGPAGGTPVAIDASSKDEVAWVAATNGLGAVSIVSKSSHDVDYTTGGAWASVCAYGQKGRFAFCDPSTGVIDTWSQKNGPGYLGNADTPIRLACSGSFRAWIEYGDGCATLRHKERLSDSVTLIANNQPRACSIAVAGTDVYWTTCEPTGGVFSAVLK